MPLHQRWNSICLAERVGFEPTVPLLVHELSKLARSATLTPLLNWACYFFLLNIYFNMGNTNFLSLLAQKLSEGVLQTDNYPILYPFLSEGKQKYQISVNIEEIYDFLTNA